MATDLTIRTEAKVGETCLTTPAGQLRLRTVTAGSGTPLVYLHGFEQHPGAAPFLLRLAHDHEVLAPEQPGYGDSTGLDLVNDLFDLVLVYRTLLEGWGRGAVDVIGHSLGGMLASELAVFCPGLIRRLVLVNPFGLWIDDQPSLDPFGLSESALGAAKWHAPDVAPRPEPRLLEADSATSEGPILARARNLGAATKLMWPFPDRGLRRRLGYVTAPTLVVHGESDRLVPLAYSQEFERLIRGARLARIAAAGHLPMIEQEDEFVSVVTAFLRD